MNRFNDIDTDLKRTVEGRDVDWVCPECGETATQYQLKIIPTGHIEPYFPKFVPQIKESCQGCGRYRRFAPQTDIIVDRFNQRLQPIVLRAKEGRDGV